MEALLQSYYAWADVQEQRFLEWIDPSGNYKFHPGKDLPMANFATVYAFMCGYLAFVLLGTAIMKMGVPAINTTPFQFIYNPVQIILCAYITVETTLQAYKNNFSIMPCNVFNKSNPVMANVLYVFFLSKFLDLFDTVFIVLGKKWRQLSVLHVYHHLSVLFIIYMDYRVAYDGDIYPMVIMNSFVHVVMYTYYFVCLHTRDIWWKKYLTGLQLVQFLVMNLQGYFTYTMDCKDEPRRVSIVYEIYVQSLFWLFMNFYIRSYVFGKKDKKVNKKKTN